MNRFRKALLLAATAAFCLDASATSGATPGDPGVRPAASGMPSEVKAFLRRKGACDRLIEENNDDPGQLAQTVMSRQRLKCQLVDDEERRLRARYADRPDVIELIERGDD